MQDNPPARFGYRGRFVWSQVLIGVTFPLVAVGLAVGGIAALIDGVPFNGGTVAFATAWAIGGGGLGLWILFGCGYEMNVEGTMLSWRAPLRRATFDLVKTPLDIGDAANGLGPQRTLRSGTGTPPRSGA